MTPEQFRSAHTLRPFRPITIHTTSGSSFRVTHPESIWQSPQGGTVIISTGGESFVMVAMEHIAEFHFNEAQTSET